MPDNPTRAADGAHQSRHYRRAQQDRGAETRERLLAAALDAFGRLGFEGASTREIARKADANLAAIVYHFGSKEALHRAVAEHVVRELRQRLGADVDALKDIGPVASHDKRQVRRMLQRLIENQIRTLLGERDAELWSRFIMREQMEPSSAFDTIYEFMLSSHSVTRQLVARLFDIDPEGEEVSLRVYALFGQIVIFRVAQPMVLRTVGRDTLDEATRQGILDIVTTNIDRLVGISLADCPP